MFHKFVGIQFADCCFESYLGHSHSVANVKSRRAWGGGSLHLQDLSYLARAHGIHVASKSHFWRLFALQCSPIGLTTVCCLAAPPACRGLDR